MAGSVYIAYMETTRCTATNKSGIQCRFAATHIGSHGFDAKFNKKLENVTTKKA